MQIEQKTFGFLKALKQNNNREWFEANRKDYQQARQNVLDFAAEVLQELTRFDAGLKHLKAADGMFRINRDVRFSSDKSPYKTNMGFYFSEGGKKAENKAGYYVHVEPANCFAACGVWQPTTPMLKRIRQEIDYNFEAFEKIILSKALVKSFGALSDNKLSRPPKGYQPDNPAIELIKQKSFIYSIPLENETLQAPGAGKHVGRLFHTSFPFIQFLNTSMAE